jgi:hypothetical protein
MHAQLHAIQDLAATSMELAVSGSVIDTKDQLIFHRPEYGTGTRTV